MKQLNCIRSIVVTLILVCNLLEYFNIWVMEDDNAKKKGADSNECVSVVVRCRPMNSKEKNESRSSIINIDVAARQVSISNPSDKDVKSFTYDGAYDDTTQQRVFYEESCFGIIESVLEGFNGTIFAYGQTGE